jgi:hypothetical protein
MKLTKESVTNFIKTGLLIVFNLADFFASIIGWLILFACVFGEVTFVKH